MLTGDYVRIKGHKLQTKNWVIFLAVTIILSVFTGIVFWNGYKLAHQYDSLAEERYLAIQGVVTVRNTSIPVYNATVILVSDNVNSIKVFTDDKGKYEAVLLYPNSTLNGFVSRDGYPTLQTVDYEFPLTLLNESPTVGSEVPTNAKIFGWYIRDFGLPTMPEPTPSAQGAA
jgi:hypothetical protein